MTASPKIILKRSSECSQEEKDAFRELVVSGGQVTAANAIIGIERAERLAFAFRDQALAGVGCLKNPATQYRARVFEQAGCLKQPGSFPIELGYVSVHLNHQGHGLAKATVAALVENVSTKMFATSRTNKTAMHRSLESAGFRREGDAYPSSSSPAEMLWLFVRE